MKDLKHLFLSTCDLGVNLSMLRRFIEGVDLDSARVPMGLAPDNSKQLDCPFLLVTLRRVKAKENQNFDDVYVMGHVTPAAIEDVKKPDGTLNMAEQRSCNVIVVPHHCGEEMWVLRLRRNFVGKFVSIQNNGHATKGGVYGSGLFGCEYAGVFRSMPEMYQALKSIYQDL